MIRSMTKVRAGSAALIAGAMLLAACSSDGGGSGAASDWVPGPLDEFSMRIWGWSNDPAEQRTQAEEQARMDAEHREMEQIVAACMAEHGFDYIPNEQGGGTIWMADDLDIEWGSREFAETYGFGMVNDPWREHWEAREAEEEPREWFDPNQEQVDAMSEAEQAAWFEALWGPPQEPDEDGNWPDWDPANAGCHGYAQSQVWDMGRSDLDDEFGWLNDEMNTMWTQIEADPRITALNAAWASCMADAGFPGFTSAANLSSELWEEWDRIQGHEERNELFNNWDWEAFPDGPDESVIPEPDPAEVAAFGEREIAVAVADWDCRDGSDHDAVWQTVNHDHQQQFVDRHGADLEAWAVREETRRDAA